MRIVIAAIGRAKDGPEQALIQEYAKRLPWKLEIREMEARGGLPPEKRRAEEERLLLSACEGMERVVALDERGKSLSSREFSGVLSRWRGEGVASCAFVIGGADGLAETLRARAALMLSFGAMTWPHLLARAMLTEQLYRAHSLISGHPYHRA